MDRHFEFGDHALLPLSWIVEAMHAAGVDRCCQEGELDGAIGDGATGNPWERDDDRERPLPGV